MMTGEFNSFPVENIWVNREARQRRELTNIEELAESIKKIGLIHPIVIKRATGELVVGERRFTAVQQLGWTQIPVQFLDELSARDLQFIELEENLRRVNITWQEECTAIRNYHDLHRQENATWTQEDTAESLGYSTSYVSDRLQVATKLADDRVSAAPKFSTARNIVGRQVARERASEVITALAASSDEYVPAKKEAPIYNGDFLEWSAAYTGSRFNLIHCDFPYGVGMHKSDQGGGASFGTYADSPDVYWTLLRGLATAMDNVVADSAHLMFWFSMDYYHETKTLLEGMGWRINPFPLVWLKSDNTGIIPDANRGPRRIYETAFYGSRGDRQIVTPVSNGFSYPGREKSIHMNEKPVPMLSHFLRMFVDEYTVFLDPTCGSANAVKAARSLGAPTVLGIERDTEFYNLAKDHFYDTAEPDLFPEAL